MRAFFLCVALSAVSCFTSALAAPAVSESVVLEPIIVARQIQAAAASLSQKPLDGVSVDFLRYAVDLRRAYGRRYRLSNDLRDVRARLVNQPAAIFTFMERWEREANDCNGVATLALYASFADLAPSYRPLHALIDGKLRTLVEARSSQEAFRGFQCKAQPKPFVDYDVELLAGGLLGIRYLLEARAVARFSVSREAVEGKILDVEVRSAIVGLGGTIRSRSVK